MTELIIIEFPRSTNTPLPEPVKAYGCSFDDERVLVLVYEELEAAA